MGVKLWGQTATQIEPEAGGTGVAYRVKGKYQIDIRESTRAAGGPLRGGKVVAVVGSSGRGKGEAVEGAGPGKGESVGAVIREKLTSHEWGVDGRKGEEFGRDLR